jgi:hypothetical protein
MSSSNSNFAPFNENNNFSYNNRTFEELICERGEMFQTIETENNGLVDYSLIFNKIKTNLFNLNNLPDNLPDCEFIKKYREEIMTLKREVCNIYLDYMKAENLLTESREKYTIFCENIKRCIESISQTPCESDNQLKKILEKKIEIYYTDLKLDTLMLDFNKKSEIFEKTKYQVSQLTGTFLPTTICQICLENQVEYFIDPCGHTICKNCKSTCENKDVKCHYCRTVRSSYRRLYL